MWSKNLRDAMGHCYVVNPSQGAPTKVLELLVSHTKKKRIDYVSGSDDFRRYSPTS